VLGIDRERNKVERPLDELRAELAELRGVVTILQGRLASLWTWAGQAPGREAPM
jgi:hypothetical protein